MPHRLSLIVTARRLPEAGIHMEIRCALCGGEIVPLDGTYVANLALDGPDLTVRGTVRNAVTERNWSFVSGSAMAELLLLVWMRHHGCG